MIKQRLNSNTGNAPYRTQAEAMRRVRGDGDALPPLARRPQGEAGAMIAYAYQLPLVLAAKHPAIADAVDRDVRRYLQPRLDLPLPDHYKRGDLARALAHRPLRSVLYARLADVGRRERLLAALLKRVYRGAVALQITYYDVLGAGCLIRHGFATIIVARRIGRDCSFGQQVTIGYDDRGGPPVIGDRVRVGAGAIVIGPITLGDDCVVGANALVRKDVSAGTVVAAPQARVIAATDRYRARELKLRSDG